jgi:hypothetical protein
VLYYTDNKYKEYKMLFIGISVTIITICVITLAASFYKTYHDDRTNFFNLTYQGKDYEFVKERIFEIGSDGNRTEIFDNQLIINLEKKYLNRMTNTNTIMPDIVDINNDRIQYINNYGLFSWYKKLKSEYGLSSNTNNDDDDD